MARKSKSANGVPLGCAFFLLPALTAATVKPGFMEHSISKRGIVISGRDNVGFSQGMTVDGDAVIGKEFGSTHNSTLQLRFFGIYFWNAPIPTPRVELGVNYNSNSTELGGFQGIPHV